MVSNFVVVARDTFSELLSAIKHCSRKEAARQLRAAMTERSQSWENSNQGDRQAVEIDLADGKVAGFTVKFDGQPVFQYIGPETATALPTLSMTPVRQRLRANGWRDEFMLAVGDSFWSLIYPGCNGGVPFVMQHCHA